MEKEYIVELKITVDKKELEANGGNIVDMIFNATMEAPFSFSIEDCRELVSEKAIIEVGNTVTWKSREYEPEKTGEIIAIIPAGNMVSPHIPKTAKAGHIKVGSEKSIHNRVLVAVPAGKDNQLTHYYCPTEKVIIEQNG